jgi:hypothetical protein
MARKGKQAKAGAPFGNQNFLKGQPRFITEALIRHLLAVVKDPRAAATPAEAKIERRRIDFMVDTLVRLAMDGDTTCLRLVMDRVEGSAHQTMIFKPIDEQPDEAEAGRLLLTRDKLAAMTDEERTALYRSSITEAGRTLGSA